VVSADDAEFSKLRSSSTILQAVGPRLNLSVRTLGAHEDYNFCGTCGIVGHYRAAAQQYSTMIGI